MHIYCHEAVNQSLNDICLPPDIEGDIILGGNTIVLRGVSSSSY